MLVVALAGVTLSPLRAQDGKPAKEDPAHEQLRTLRREVTDAVNKNDLDRLLTHLDKDVVVTWMNAEVSRGPDGVRAYYDKMTKGPDRVVESVTINPEVDELTHLYGDTGIASGSSQDHFKLADGRDFVVPTRWSGTLVRKDGRWLIAEFHASTNLFDNPVLHIAIRKTATWVGCGAAVAGLLVGFVVARLLRRRSPAGGGGVPPARA
jgi:ketosteroid isomerase-like protein